MKYEFHPEALVEFEAATDYYAECQNGLEIRFIDAVTAAVSHACEAPERWRIFDGEIRRVLVHVFPYLHARRMPHSSLDNVVLWVPGFAAPGRAIGSVQVIGRNAQPSGSPAKLIFK